MSGYEKKMCANVPLKTVCETRVQYETSRGNPREDWNGMITKLLASKAKDHNRSKLHGEMSSFHMLLK